MHLRTSRILTEGFIAATTDITAIVVAAIAVIMVVAVTATDTAVAIIRKSVL
jgi:hypothetical protein